MPRQVRVAAALAATIAVAAAPRAAALSSSIIGVPDRMIPSQSILKADFGKASLIPLDIALSSVKESDALTGSDAIKSHTGKHGAVCFVVRRPG